jgi:ABC-type phosphate transport system substrate-binding protein
MKRLSTSRLPLILLASLLCTRAAVAQKADFAVVVNVNNSVTNLTLADVRNLFAGGKHSWPGGAPVKLFVRASGTEERTVLLKLLGMSESEYKQHWISQVFRGDAQAEPPTLPSNGMQKEAVAAFPGGIALMSSQDVKPGMKVVHVNGRLPGEPGYPLH